MTELLRNAVLIEDEKLVRRYVAMALSVFGFKVWEADTAQQGMAEVTTRHPELIVLDLGLPDWDGVDVIHELRKTCETPILVLSVRTEEVQKVEALDAGADDYLTKPFGVLELQARIRAILRRTLSKANDAEEDRSLVRFGDLLVDINQRLVSLKDKPIHLTPLEYRILTLLVANVGRVLTHRQILREIWGEGYMDRPHYLRVFMAGLRRKIEENPANPRYILTETGIGYRFAPC
ncbi:MAG: response regulator [Magnetococcales bacterium]|nr:response regulator [Magnetococcales bacterium]